MRGVRNQICCFVIPNTLWTGSCRACDRSKSVRCANQLLNLANLEAVGWNPWGIPREFYSIVINGFTRCGEALSVPLTGFGL